MDVPYFRLELNDSEIDAVVSVLRSGWLTTGKECAAFEQEFAAAVGGDIEAVAINSNTAGLHLALEAAGIGPGDEVIVPDLTFTATAEVARYLGAEVVFADVLADTLCIDPERVKCAITDRTKAVIPVHFGGQGADLAGLKSAIASRDIKIIVDAAHSFPCVNRGVVVGQEDVFATVFSFYANKTITTGEGGMIVTSDKAVAQRCRTMRLHGIDRDAFQRFQGHSAGWNYDVVAPGYKYNLTDMAAALGRKQLSRALEMQRQREAIASQYFRGLQGLALELPTAHPDTNLHAWHLFPIRLNQDAPVSREQLEAYLTKNGIGYSLHYTPLHRMSYWKSRYGLSDNQFPISTNYFERSLSLPIFSSMTTAEVDRVVEVLVSALGENLP